MERRIREAVYTFAPDRVQAEFLAMAPYGRAIRHPHVALNIHEAFGRAWPRKVQEGGRLRAPCLFLDCWNLARAEARILGEFLTVLTFSPEDRDYLLSRNPGAAVRVWRPGVRLPSAAPRCGDEEGGGCGLLFVGSFRQAPDVDGVRYFCREVLPRIRRGAPAAGLDIVGPDPPASVRKLSGPGVRVHGTRGTWSRSTAGPGCWWCRRGSGSGSGSSSWTPWAAASRWSFKASRRSVMCR